MVEVADKSQLVNLIQGLPAVGYTPITKALKAAGVELSKDKAPSGLILITDGLDTCNGDPAAEAAQLVRDLNLTFGVNVIGFDIKAGERDKLDQIAKAGHGNYYNARNADEFRRVIRAIHKKLDGPVAVKTNQGETLQFNSRASWADRCVSFKPGADFLESRSEPAEALGAPNYRPDPDDRYVALGRDGELILEFVDNVFIDVEGPDLAVFEIGPLVEATRLAISTDGKTWIDVGRTREGGKSTLDISPFRQARRPVPFRQTNRLRQRRNGADIDAVGTIGSVRIDDGDEVGTKTRATEPERN